MSRAARTAEKREADLALLGFLATAEVCTGRARLDFGILVVYSQACREEGWVMLEGVVGVVGRFEGGLRVELGLKKRIISSRNLGVQIKRRLNAG